MFFHKYNTLIVLAAATFAAAGGENLTALFAPHVSKGTTIASSSDGEFTSLLPNRWSTWEAPTYSGVITPVTEKDVQVIVRIARSNKIPFLATSRGHGTNIGTGTVKNALSINLGHFNTVSVDAVNNRLTIGGAVAFGDIFDPVWNAGKEIQTGNSQCVGMVGATIGAAIGSLTGVHGPTIDALESVRIVTGSGDLVTASATENEDLFWAVRGAGANYGIITSATFILHEQTNAGKAVLATFSFPAASNRTVWKLLRSYDDFIPAPLAAFSAISYNHTTEAATIGVSLVYFGTQAELQPELDKVNALKPATSTVSNLTVPEVYALLSEGDCVNGKYQNEYTLGLKQIDTETWEDVFGDLVAFFKAHPTYDGQPILQRYNNEKTLQGPDTAFPWRDAKTWLLWQNIYSDSSLDEEVKRLSDSVRSRLQATSGFSEPHVYVNYAYGDEGPKAWWGERNLAKLRGLKKIWDPDNLFGKGSPLF